MIEPAVQWPADAARLPTLTEVVELDVLQPAPVSDERPPPPQPIDMALLVDRVLAEIAPHVDDLFEARVRGALAPAVARAVGGLLTESRTALSASLRVLVEEAVERALQKAATDRRSGRA